jgi:hypothetical protein
LHVRGGVFKLPPGVYDGLGDELLVFPQGRGGILERPLILLDGRHGDALVPSEVRGGVSKRPPIFLDNYDTLIEIAMACNPLTG